MVALVAQQAAFEYRSRQLFDKQRNAVGACDDMRDDIAGQNFARHSLGKDRTVARVEPIEQ